MKTRFIIQTITSILTLEVVAKNPNVSCVFSK